MENCEFWLLLRFPRHKPARLNIEHEKHKPGFHKVSAIEIIWGLAVGQHTHLPFSQNLSPPAEHAFLSELRHVYISTLPRYLDKTLSNYSTKEGKG